MLKRLDLFLRILYNGLNKAADIVMKKAMKNRYAENVSGNMAEPRNTVNLIRRKRT